VPPTPQSLTIAFSVRAQFVNFSYQAGRRVFWTWVSGSKTGLATSAGAVYGTKGTPSTSNTPGVREDTSCIFDDNGYLWVFDGLLTSSTDVNDLWRFNPATLEWTWPSGSSAGGASGVYGTIGVAAPLNVPSGRDASCSWVDGSGNLWLFGGEYGAHAIAAPVWNDLWKATVY
jgi:hypothetical protein